MSGTWAEKGTLGGGSGGSDALAVNNLPPGDGPLPAAVADGGGGIALGYGAHAEEGASVAAGIMTRAGDGSVAVGAGATAGMYAVAAGPSATASGMASGAYGYYANAFGIYAFAMAPGSMVRGDFAVGAGPMVEVNHSNSFVFGVDLDENGDLNEPGYTTDPNQVVLGMSGHSIIIRGKLVLRSPNGSFFSIQVDDTGELSTTPVTLSPKPEHNS
ncbi:hypothetical protein P9990_17475 [Prescottella equi]|uniref:hypothetical protein n=1 Tax=Rhodococcus hoagii TaxID=43767 RepID=UPI002576C340|nr:hypothetical protein [Prescottella equi]WJJ10362.1 hypothetical protein P9990_17475 [Prescottella equi]